MAKPDAAEILVGMAVTGEEKLTFLPRLQTAPGELGRVLTEVASGETYIVARTNTIVNTRRPDPFEPVAVVMPYEEYQLLKRLEGDR